MANNIRNMVNTLQTVPESQTADHVTNNTTANNQTAAAQPETKAPSAPATASMKARSSSAAAAAAKVGSNSIIIAYSYILLIEVVCSSGSPFDWVQENTSPGRISKVFFA